MDSATATKQLMKMNNNISCCLRLLLSLGYVTIARADDLNHNAKITNQVHVNEAEQAKKELEIADSISCAAAERYTFIASDLMQNTHEEQFKKQQLEYLVRDAFNYYLQGHGFEKKSSFIVDGGISLSIDILKQNPEFKKVLDTLLSDPLQLDAVKGTYNFAFLALDKSGSNKLTKQNYPLMVQGFHEFLQQAPKTYKAGMKRRIEQSLRNTGSLNERKVPPQQVNQPETGDNHIFDALQNDASIGYMKMLYYLEFTNEDNDSDFENTAGANLAGNFFAESFEYFVQSRLTRKFKAEKIDAAIRLVFSELQKQDKFKKVLATGLHNPLRRSKQKPEHEQWSTRLEGDVGLVNENYDDVVARYREFLLHASPETK